ncbi:MAG: DUF4123 domain-containing protein [Gammaproteobacteria bacterium]|nr:DUF4123 domain-containing protein [Gammaproteobacteria bacterium]MDH5729130.1 DUF4123 domain-containing protein [Gammaproteobacteria bacterium]
MSLESKQTNIYAIVDAAQDKRLQQAIEKSGCLYRCLLDIYEYPALASAAPYLVKTNPDTLFFKALFSEGLGLHWCSFATSVYSFDIVLEHFQFLLYVKLETGKKMLFRYYDPRVMRAYLPSCNMQELQSVFGPIESYWLEDDLGQHYIRFQLMQKQLKKQTLNFNNPSVEPA